jgi:O-antigen/teichoic acid export membrane protein
VAVVRKANKLFPFILTKKKYTVSADIKKNITTNMKALFLHGLGGYFMHSTDNIILSSYLGLWTVGLLSNYTLIISTIKNITSQIIMSFSESIGHLIATESKEKIYKTFQTLFFINYIVISIPVIILCNTINPFVQWWFGDAYTLPNYVIGVLLFNFFVDNMRSSALIFKTKSGIFTQDKFSPLLQGIINLVLSLFLVRYFELAGVLIATGISILSIGFWQFPRLIYKYTFGKPLRLYFKTFFSYVAISLLALIISITICSLFQTDNYFLKTIINSVISIVIIIVLYTIAYYKSEPANDLFFHLKLITHKIR